MLAATLAEAKPRNFIAKSAEWFTFETALGRGIGHLRLRGKHAWTLLTTLRELKGFEERREEMRSSSNAPSPTQAPYVLIVGGGQGGIALAARLKRLGVPAVVVEKNER